MPARANLRPSPRRTLRWHRALVVVVVVVVVLLAAAGCSGAADAPSSPPATPPAAAPTATSVPAFDRGRFAAIIPLAGAAVMTVADGRLWVLKGAGTVVGVDPRTNRVLGKPLGVPADAQAIAVGERALWVTRGAPGDLAGSPNHTVTRIDPAAGRRVATIRVRRAPLDIAVTPGAVWVTNSSGDSVVRIDPQTNRAVETIAVGGHPLDVAATQGAVWVSVTNPGTVLRIAGR